MCPTTVLIPLWAGLLVAAHALMIKEEPQSDTKLYVAPVSYTRKDGKSLPSTIIVSSRPIGIVGDGDKIPTAHDTHHLPSKGTGSFSLIVDNDGKGDSIQEDSSSNINIKPAIKFYTIECTSEKPCTSIIPAQTPRPESKQTVTRRPWTKDEIRNYLRQFSLRDGFPYSSDFEESGSPDGPLSEGEKNPEGDQSHRAFGSSNYDDFWPGSQYRPRPSNPSKGQVYKYQQYKPPAISGSGSAIEFPKRQPPSLSWDRISDSLPKWDKAPHQESSRPIRPSLHSSRPSNNSPSLPSRKPSHPSRPYVPFGYGLNKDGDILPLYDSSSRYSSHKFTTTKPRPSPFEGVWNKYGTSTVSQLDRGTGKWVKVSSSTTHLDEEVIGRPATPPTVKPQPPSHHAQASLHVLGVNEKRRPHPTFLNTTPSGTHLVAVPNAVPGKPLAVIETSASGGKVYGSTSLALPVTDPRDKPSFSSLAPHTSVTPPGLVQIRHPIKVEGKFVLSQ